MRRMIGFILFWIAVGMTIMLFLRHAFFSLLLIILFYFLSYYLFCKCWTLILFYANKTKKAPQSRRLYHYLFSSYFTHSSETWSTQIHLLVIAAYVQTYASDVGLPHLVCSTGYVTSGLAYCLSEQSRLITHCTSCHEYAPPWVKKYMFVHTSGSVLFSAKKARLFANMNILSERKSNCKCFL